MNFEILVRRVNIVGRIQGFAVVGLRAGDKWMCKEGMKRCYMAILGYIA